MTSVPRTSACADIQQTEQRGAFIARWLPFAQDAAAARRWIRTRSTKPLEGRDEALDLAE